MPVNEETGFVDLPAGQDMLGCDAYFDGLASFIRTCPTPMTIAIQGGWGTGKTSAIRIIESKLKGSGICLSEFNTWQYTKVAGRDLYIPLMFQLRDSIDEAAAALSDADRKAYEKQFEKKSESYWKMLVGGVTTVGLGALESISGTGIVNEVISKAAESSSQSTEELSSVRHFNYIVALREDLKQRIRFIQGRRDGNARFVFFIDDLDRLSPEVAVELLEDMKNFMEFESCVFVLALDHDIVRRGLDQKFGSNLDKTYSEHFFDKIIQVPFTLPVQQYDMHAYLNELCGRQYGDVTDAMADVVVRFGDTNPRSIKRVLNILQLYRDMPSGPVAKKDSEGASEVAEMFAIMLLQVDHRDLYKEMVKKLEEDRDFFETDGYFEQRSTKYDAWRKSLDEDDARIMECLEELFRKQDGRPLPRLFRMVMEANAYYAGDAHMQRKRRSTSTKSTIDRYLKRQGFVPDQSKDTASRTSYKPAGGLELQTVIPDKMGTHVNINIRCKEGCVFSDRKLEALMQEAGMQDAKAHPAPTKSGRFELVSKGSRSCCLYSIDLEQGDAGLIIGNAIRAIKDGKWDQAVVEQA